MEIIENIGSIIRKDRISQGLSLRGLAKKLNEDRSLELERAVTTSWLHHLENGRAKPLTPDLKRGIARALHQDETKYLSIEDLPQTRPENFVRFFDEQIHSCEPGSTLVCDINTDFTKVEDLAEILICLYNFVVQTNGNVIAFERSNYFALPVFLTAVRSWPDVDDINLNEVVSRVLTPVVSGGFIECKIPKPDKKILEWVTERLEIYEMSAKGQATTLLSNDLFSYLVVISSNQRRGGMPSKRAFYYLGPQDYGMLDKSHTEQIYSRFEQYRDQGIFSKANYQEEFTSSYAEIGNNFQLVFV